MTSPAEDAAERHALKERAQKMWADEDKCLLEYIVIHARAMWGTVATGSICDIQANARDLQETIKALDAHRKNKPA